MKNARKGFTLAEILAVVAILAILFGVGVPSVISIRNRLEKQRLDDTAREIYMAAQSRLTAMKAAGTMDANDYSKDTNDDTYCLCSSEGILPVGSIEGGSAAGYDMVWFNANTGNVLRVRYSEEIKADKLKGTDLENTGKFGWYPENYDGTIESGLQDVSNLNVNDDPDAKMKTVYLKAPIVTLTNGDELTLKVTLSDSGTFESGSTLTITINDKAFQTVVPASSSYSGTWTLDSLDSSKKQFKGWNLGITPGSDITVKATLTKENTADTTYVAGGDRRSKATANSLFASVSGGTASISNLRHLQNLSNTFSGVEGITGAALTKDIDCTTRSFTAIDVKNNGSLAFNGDNHTLSNLHSSTGLFGSMTGGSITNLKLNNPVISGGSNAGALAVSLTNTAVSGVQVYGKSSSVSGSGTVGGLIGSISGNKASVKNCSASVITVSGATAGGLIGSMGGGSVTNCYAACGDRGAADYKWRNGVSGSTKAGGLIGSMTGGSVSHCYVSGYVTGGTTGGILGSGGGTLSDCYSVATVNGTTKKGIAGSGTPTIVGTSVFFWSSGCSGDSAGVSFDTITDLVGSSGWVVGSAALTDAYTPNAYEDATKVYPYPTVSGLSYHGDWPVEVVTDVGVFTDEACTQRIQYLMIPTGESRTVYVSALSGTNIGAGDCTLTGSSASFQYSFTKPGSEQVWKLDISAKTGSGGTLTPGIYGLYLQSEDISVCFLIGAYDVTLKLEPSSDTGTAPRTATCTMSGGKTTTVFGQVSFDPADHNGTITASVTVSPSLSQIQSAYAAFNTASDATISLSDIQTDYGTIGKIWLSAVDNTGEVFNAPPTAVQNSGYAFAITGNNIGKARLRAKWDKKQDITTDCIVEVKGNRVLIYQVTATGGSMSSGTGMSTYISCEYPYSITINPAVGQDVTVKVTPKMFFLKSHSDTNSKYVWEVYRGNTKVAEKPVSGSAWSATGTYSFTISGAGALITESYRVVLTYKYQSATENETSTDEVLITVNRKAARGTNNYDKLVILEKPSTTWKNVSSGTVNIEQVDGAGTSYAGCNTTELAGYLAGVLNTQIKWYVCTAGGMGNVSASGSTVWTAISGSSETISVYNGSVERATVSWNPNTDVLNNYSTGGSVLVTGLDVGDNGSSDFVFLLKAVSVDPVDGELASAYRIIEVHVKPILNFSPKVHTVVCAFGKPGSYTTYSANRQDAKWSYDWKVQYTPTKQDKLDNRWSSVKYNGNTQTIKGNKSSSFSGTSYQLQIIHSGAAFHEGHGVSLITLQYGPHTVSATYMTKDWSDAAQTSIEYDVYDGTTYYYLAEKDQTQSMKFLWGASVSFYVKGTTAGDGSKSNSTTPINNAYLTITTTNSKAATTQGNTGEVTYTVTGHSFTKNGPQTVSWKLNDRLSPNGNPHTYSFHVYGLDVRDTNSSGSVVSGLTMSAVGGTKTLYADTFFPAELMTSGKVEWQVDHPELVKLSATSGNSVTLTAQKYTTKNYYATVTCVYTVKAINGQEYRCTKNIPVKVEKSGSLTFSVSAATRSEAAAAFGTVGSWVNQKEADGSWILVEDATYGANVMYLKVTPSSSQNLDQYYRNFHSDAYFVELESKVVGNYIYIKLSAKDGTGTENAQTIDLTLELGATAQKTEKIKLYQAPKVQIFNSSGADVTGGSQSITNAAAKATSFTGVSGFYATLTPLLKDSSGKTMDTIIWSLDCPEGYQLDDYVYLTAYETAAGSAGKTNVLLKTDDNSHKMIPDFRVFLRAKASRSTNSEREAGYALVFLPAVN